MTDTTRDLIQRLADALDHLNRLYNVPNQSALIEKAYDYLAQPEPEELTDEELLQIAAATIDPYESKGIALGEYEAETECAVEAYGSELIAFARAVLSADRARWGRPTTTQEDN